MLFRKISNVLLSLYLLNAMKAAGIIKKVTGLGAGKYVFIELQE